MSEAAAAVRELLEAGGRFPGWTEEELEPEVPDPRARARLVAELRPRGTDFFEERIPAPGWPGLPGAYLRLTDAYVGPAAEARELGWPTVEMLGSHFHMLVDPGSVAEAVADLADRL
jgi:hypothetical protein